MSDSSPFCVKNINIGKQYHNEAVNIPVIYVMVKIICKKFNSADWFSGENRDNKNTEIYAIKTKGRNPINQRPLLFISWSLLTVTAREGVIIAIT